MTLRALPLSALALALLLGGCAPTVNVAVPKPVVIDVNMKVDVTSRNETPAPKKDDAKGGAAEDAHLLSGEVQSLKDSRLVGEAATGYLAVRDVPSGKIATGEDYAVYVKRIVEAENTARRTLYGDNAAKHGTTLDDEARAAGKRLAETAYSGEWIQDASGKWQQK